MGEGWGEGERETEGWESVIRVREGGSNIEERKRRGGVGARDWIHFASHLSKSEGGVGKMCYSTFTTKISLERSI